MNYTYFTIIYLIIKLNKKFELDLENEVNKKTIQYMNFKEYEKSKYIYEI